MDINLQICLLYTYIYTLPHIPFIVGEKGISGADAGYPPLPTDLLRRGVTALQPTAAFAKLNPSRRQDEQPEKWLGSGRGRVPELSGVQRVPGDSISWAGSRCFAAHQQMLYFCSVRVQAVKCWTPTGATLAGIFMVSLREVLMKLEALSRALNPTGGSKAVVPGGPCRSHLPTSSSLPAGPSFTTEANPAPKTGTITLALLIVSSPLPNEDLGPKLSTMGG